VRADLPGGGALEPFVPKDLWLEPEARADAESHATRWPGRVSFFSSGPHPAADVNVQGIFSKMQLAVRH
jgi:hypothetical protein